MWEESVSYVVVVVGFGPHNGAGAYLCIQDPSVQSTNQEASRLSSRQRTLTYLVASANLMDASMESCIRH